jgi:biotin carboxylase
MKPRILLLATTTGYQTRAFGEAAERIGVELVFATDRCDQLDDPWQDSAIPIRFHDEDRSVEEIVDRARPRKIDGLLVVGDRPTVIAARVAAALGLPWHPAEASRAARDKRRTRERLQAAGMLVPRFISTSTSAIPRQLAGSVPFPCVVKPVALSGSRGVIRADDAESFVAAFERLRAILRSADIQAERSDAHTSVLVEEFIPGREYAIEGLLHHGVLKVLAVFDKPDPLDGPFFEETIYVTPSSAPEPLQEAIVETVRRAALALGLHHGSIHAECRANDRGVFVLEVAARPIGGLCARALAIGGRPLEEMLLRHALGEDPSEWRLDSEASGVMMIPIPRRGVLRGVSGTDAATAVRHVTELRVTAKVDQLLVPLPDGASYLGFIFARAAEAGDAVRALRAAHGRLEFRIDPELTVISPGQIQYNLTHG